MASMTATSAQPISTAPAAPDLGAIQIGLAYACLTRGLRQVPALEASLLLMVEPVLNPVWAWLVHGERPSHWALLGGALIIGATTAQAVVQGREEPA